MSRKGQKRGRDFNILVSCYVLFLISCNDSVCQSCQGAEGHFLRHISLLLTGREKCLCACTRVCGGTKFDPFHSGSEEKVKCEAIF